MREKMNIYLRSRHACEVTDHRADLFCWVLCQSSCSVITFLKPFPEKTIENILKCPPKFSEIRPDIDERLNLILHTALRRPRDERYQSAEEMLTELESFIYGEGYGPTNEKLAAYIYDPFSKDGANAALRWHRGETQFAPQ